MTKQITTTYTDDLDGKTRAEPYSFGWQGTTYDIDLSATHRKQLEKIFGPLVEYGRKVRPAPVTSGPRKRATADRAQMAAMRKWARSRGMEVSDRGRIPEKVTEAYHQRDTQ